MTFVLQVLGGMLLVWLAFYFALMVVAFWMGFSEAAKMGKRRQQRNRVCRASKPKLRVIWPD